MEDNIEGIYVCDVEGDGLNPTKIYVLSCSKDGKTVFSTSDYDEMRKFLLSQKVIVGHHFKRWDKVHLERILDIKITAKIVDTLALSWYLYPTDDDGETRRKHGLEEWGEKFGIPKPKITDWVNLSYDEYRHRCEEDVKINYRLWANMWLKLQALYQSEDKIWRFLDYLEFKMHCGVLQERAGWKIDIDYATKSLIELLDEQSKRVDRLRAVMPKVPIIKKKSPPKRMYKGDGTPSKIGKTWLEMIEQQNLPQDIQEVEYIDGHEEPNPNSSDQVKSWLYTLGWVPKTFKEVKDDKTGAKRQIPQVNKEKQKRENDDDILCDSVTDLFDKEPELENLQGLGILRHRIGIINGFLRDVDGNDFIRARFSGLTNTLRFKHAEIVNLPKVDLPYAKAVRGSLIAPEGFELCGADKSGLEDRLKQHFIYPYDPEYVNEMMDPNYDPHLSLALLAKAVTREQVDDYISKKNKSIKPIRDIYKNGNYA